MVTALQEVSGSGIWVGGETCARLPPESSVTRFVGGEERPRKASYPTHMTSEQPEKVTECVGCEEGPEH